MVRSKVRVRTAFLLGTSLCETEPALLFAALLLDNNFVSIWLLEGPGEVTNSATLKQRSRPFREAPKMLASISELSRQGAAYCNQIKNNFALTLSPRQCLKISIYGIHICSLFIMGVCIFLTLSFYNPKILGSTASWLSISVAGITLWFMSIIGLRGSYLVNLELLLTYFWGISVFVSALTLAVVACLDSYLYMDIWVRHRYVGAAALAVVIAFCACLSAAVLVCFCIFVVACLRVDCHPVPVCMFCLLSTPSHFPPTHIPTPPQLAGTCV
jgi:hypothetical protein